MCVPVCVEHVTTRKTVLNLALEYPSYAADELLVLVNFSLNILLQALKSAFAIYFVLVSSG